MTTWPIIDNHTCNAFEFLKCVKLTLYVYLYTYLHYVKQQYILMHRHITHNLWLVCFHRRQSSILHGHIYHTCITCVLFSGVLHVFRICNTSVCPTPVLYMYFYTCDTCVGHTFIIHVWNMCITDVLHMYYIIHLKYHTCITCILHM